MAVLHSFAGTGPTKRGAEGEGVKGRSRLAGARSAAPKALALGAAFAVVVIDPARVILQIALNKCIFINMLWHASCKGDPWPDQYLPIDGGLLSSGVV